MIGFKMFLEKLTILQQFNRSNLYEKITTHCAAKNIESPRNVNKVKL